MDAADIILTVNFGLIFVNAICDYAAVPIFVERHAAAESEPARIMRNARGLIAFQVGAYTMIVMWLHTATWYYGLIFTALITLDTSMSIRAIKGGTSYVSKP